MESLGIEQSGAYGKTDLLGLILEWNVFLLVFWKHFDIQLFIMDKYISLEPMEPGLWGSLRRTIKSLHRVER